LIERNYIYLGDRMTDPELKGGVCKAVVRADGKCIRGKNGSMLVSFSDKKVVVIAKLLRKNKGMIFLKPL
jgi:ribosomal protein L14